MILILLLLLLINIRPCFAQSVLKPTAVAIAGGQGIVGFDDLNFSRNLNKVLVPAGRTGKLYLIDPPTYTMESINGFSSSVSFQKGHRTGISSADAGDGYIFVADHGTRTLDAVDINTRVIVCTASLADDADFVRYIPKSHEVWVTEPDAEDKKVEVFTFTAGKKPEILHKLDIPVADGPESLTIDKIHQKAYTNIGKQVGVIDLRTHSIAAEWQNTCEKPRGTAIDAKRGFLFVGCGEGKVVTLNVDRNGMLVGKAKTGEGIDLIDYNPGRSHLYVTGSKSATVSVLGVSNTGQLSLLGTGKAALRSHCVTGDDQNNIWVCDPKHGQLLRYKDSLPVGN